MFNIKSSTGKYLMYLFKTINDYGIRNFYIYLLELFKVLSKNI